jgi:hypothetical protein
MSSIFTARIEENIVNRKYGKSTVILSNVKDLMGIVIKEKARYDYYKNSNILGNYKNGDSIEFTCGFKDGEIEFIGDAKIIGYSCHPNSAATTIIKDPHKPKYFTRFQNGRLVEIKGKAKRFDYQNSSNDSEVEEEKKNKLEIFFELNKK